jgi:PAS domain S-box-containing protein
MSKSHSSESPLADRAPPRRALRKSGERFSNYFELGLIGMAITSLAKGCVEVNGEICRILGYERSELLRMTWAELTHPDDLAADLANFNRVLAGEIDSYSMEKRFIRKDGQVIGTTISVKCLRGADGSIDYFMALLQDITERKRAEERLRNVGRQLADAQRLAQIGSWEWDITTDTVTWSDEKYRIMGLEPSEAPTTYASFLDRVHPDDRSRMDEAVQRARRDHKPFSYDYRVLLPTGEARVRHGQGAVFTDETGHATRMFGTTQDITERKVAEERLREYEKVVEGLEEMIVVVDRNYRYLLANRAFLKYRGLERQQVLGRLVPEILNQGVFENVVRKKLDECLLGRPVQYEMRYRYPNRGERDLLISYFPIEGAAGFDRAACVLQDVTERKQADEKLRAVSRRLFQVRDDERRHLARELHDEIGQALTAAKINLESIESPEGSAQSLRLKETSTLLDNVLQQVRQISLDLHSLLLDDLGLVPALRSLLDQQAGRAGLRAQFEAEEPLENIDPEVQTTGFRIAQEAITNVLRHAKAQSVRVHLQAAAGQLQIKIVDDGVGFDLLEIERRAQHQASFGLMGMRERAVLVGGRMHIISSPNKGTTIEVSLPLQASAKYGSSSA